MARFRVMSDEELVGSLRAKFKAAHERVERMRPELDMCRATYQAISQTPQGGLDAQQAIDAWMRPSGDEYDSFVVQGLDTVKATLFLHSKLCISDPAVTVTAQTQDQAAKRTAEFTQYFISYFKRHIELGEILESGPFLRTSVFGSGPLYIGFNTDAGQYPLNQAETTPDSDPNGFEVKMEGDFEAEDVAIEDFLIDARAKTWRKAEHCFRRKTPTIEEALYTFPDQVDVLREHVNRQEAAATPAEKEKVKNVVDVWEYWEKALPWNGLLGMRVFFVDPENPKILKREKHPFDHGRLPFGFLTDIDVPDHPYGMSRIVYTAQVQQSIDMMLTAVLNNIQLHGTAKYFAPSGSLSDRPKNSPDDITFFNPDTGAKIEVFRPVSVTTDVWKGWEIMSGYINNFYGMNEFSQGQIPRELSSYAVQLALEMDDKYRIRLFNKKKLFLKDLYTMAIQLAQQFINDQRKLEISGVEGWSDVQYFNGSMLKGNSLIDVEYGPYIPVDPAAKKQQLIEFVKSGMYEKAGGDMRKMGKLLIDGSMLDVKHMFDSSSKRQKEEIDKIIAGENPPVEEWDKHVLHGATIDDYCESAEFARLPAEIKKKIWAHGQEHAKWQAKIIAQSGQFASPAGGAQGGGQPQPGMAPAGGGGPAAQPPPNPMTQSPGPIV